MGLLLKHAMKRVKFLAIGAFIGLMLVWIGIMIAGALSDGPAHPALERVLKK